MGPKGGNVQKITSEHQVQIKFPEKARTNGNGTPNGDLNGEETNGHVTPDNTEIIKISGKKENCEAAAAALKALVPINIEVSHIQKFCLQPGIHFGPALLVYFVSKGVDSFLNTGRGAISNV